MTEVSVHISRAGGPIFSSSTTALAALRLTSRSAWAMPFKDLFGGLGGLAKSEAAGTAQS
jgi:hypothetical protein